MVSALREEALRAQQLQSEEALLMCLVSNITASEESYVLRRAPRVHVVAKLSARH